VKERTNAFGQPVGPALPGWTPRPPPPRSALTGRYCRLEPVEARHAPDLFAAFSQAPDDRDWTYLMAERPATEAALRESLANLSTSADPMHFAILCTDSGKPVGTAALMRIEPKHGVIEIGSITYSPRLKRTRAGTEAMYLFMRLAFDDLGYRRYEWKCDSLNAPSRSAAQRYGFSFEGIFRQSVVYKGRSRDTAWYSIIAEEWPRVRAAFDAWLDPGNFDADGRQRRDLKSLRASLR